jgi:predicted nucleic acid-binding Zn ribbon protein
VRPIKKGNEYSLKEAIDEMLKSYRLDHKLDETKAVNAWEKVVGEVITRYTTNLRVTDGVLYVTLSSAALKQELLYLRTEIADLLNAECGGKIIREVVILG